MLRIVNEKLGAYSLRCQMPLKITFKGILWLIYSVVISHPPYIYLDCQKTQLSDEEHVKKDLNSKT